MILVAALELARPTGLDLSREVMIKERPKGKYKREESMDLFLSDILKYVLAWQMVT